MTKYYVVAGKGGSGKTAFTALLLQRIRQQNQGQTVLAVDSDSNANLNEVLGIRIDQTISKTSEETKSPASLPAGMPKDLFIEQRLQQSIMKTPDFDLLVMGNPSGPGCYCYPHDLLRRYLGAMSQDYDIVIIDSDDGLEQISRRTVPHIDVMFIVSDSTARGVCTAGRIKSLIRTLNLSVKDIFLVINMTSSSESLNILDKEIKAAGLACIGEVPRDPLIEEYDLRGKPLYNLPQEATSLKYIDKILKKVNLDNY